MHFSASEQLLRYVFAHGRGKDKRAFQSYERRNTYLHCYNLAFAFGTKWPLIADNFMVITALVSIQCDEVLRQSDRLIRSCISNRWVIHWLADSQKCNGGVGCSIWINHCESTTGKTVSVKMNFCQMEVLIFFWHFFKHHLNKSHWLYDMNFCFRHTYPSTKARRKFRKLYKANFQPFTKKPQKQPN